MIAGMATGVGGEHLSPTPSRREAGSSIRVRLALLFTCAIAAALGVAAPAGARRIAGPGSKAGEVEVPVGVAVDQSTGTLYVADGNNKRVDEFSREGVFLRAFGFGVRDGGEKLEVCTLITECRGGLPSTEASPGEVAPNGGIAVDPATHHVYVSESPRGEARVEVFTEGGAFVTMFGAGVDKGPHHPGNVCSQVFIEGGDSCGAGELTTEPGGFGSEGNLAAALPLAVDGSGDLWVGDVNRLEKFSASGFVEELALPGAQRVESLGLDALGDFFTLGFADEEVRKLDEKGAQIFAVDGPPGKPRGLTFASAGSLYVGDEGPPYHLIQMSAADGEEEEVFGVGSLIGNPNHAGDQGNILAFDDATSTVYAVSSEGGEHSAVTALPVPAPGPLQRGLNTEAVRGTHAKLTDVLDAEGAETEYEFQYVDEATFKADNGHEFEHALKTAPQKLAANFAETPINAEITGLKSETVYHFRVVAHNSHGNLQTAEGAVETAEFRTTPPVEIDATFVTEVTTDSATLNASLNPEGASSSFHFEYLPSSAYQANLEEGRAPFAGAVAAPTPDGSLGAGEAPVTVAQVVGGLAAGVTYEFRVVGSNIGGSGASVAKAFEIRPIGEATLPDGRAWELVSPPEKHGALFEGILDTGIVQAAATGGGITYLATRPVGESPQGYLLKEQVMSQRTPAGWTSQDMSLPHETAPGVSLGVGEEYRFFSEDLSVGIAQPFGKFDPAVSEEASEETPLLRGTGPGGGYEPLVVGCPPPGQECRTAVESHANVPAGTRFGIAAESLEPCTTGICGVQYVGASPDGKHVILESPVVGLTETSGDHGGLYEWSNGSLTLVSVLPTGTPASYHQFQEAPRLGRHNTTYASLSAVGAVSEDGTRVDWTFGGHLYQRNLTTDKTIKIDTPSAGGGLQPENTHPEYQAASADGKVVYFTDEQKLLKEAGPAMHEPDLYRCVIAEGAGAPKCELTDLAPGVHVVGALLGVSSDGSYAYFMADGALAGGKSGNCATETLVTPNAECNLYQWHEGAVKLVARLSGEDGPDWLIETSRQTSRVSPDGQWLEFMSQLPLTGYENVDVHSGEADEEVFLYDAGAEKVVCVSCNPSGQRPDGAEYGRKDSASGGNIVWPPATWLAANVPGWTSYHSADAQHQPRYLSNSGRLFFNSHDSLSATDTNSAEDVYEFEPGGVGSCTSTQASFVAANEGCVSLISSGTSRSESALLDASEFGDDVYFLTASELTGEDKDDAIDVYDAHVCQPSDPCVSAPPASAEECSGEGCQPQLAVPSEPSIASLLVSGLGNLSPLPGTAPPKPPKPPKLTPAQRLNRALKACRKKHTRTARQKCETQARRSYRAAVKHAKRARRKP
jgi:DNA-binding beta-propeller fold protein YncE